MPAKHPPELAREREEAILCAARQVFATKGFESTRIQDVADAMGIAKGTVYLYFRSKDDLYWAVLRAGLEDLHRRSAEALARQRGAEAKLRAFLATRLEFFEERRDIFRVYFGEMGHWLLRHGAHLAQLEDLYLEQVAMLRAVVEDGIAEGALRPLDPQATAFAVLDLVRGRVAQRLRGWSTATQAADLDDLFRLLWRGIAT